MDEGLETKWLANSNKKPVANRALWEQLDSLLGPHKVVGMGQRPFRHPQNERCDELASTQAALFTPDQ